VSHVRGFYGWALDEGLLDIDPSRRLRRPRREQRIPRPMPDDSAGRALAEAPDPIRQWLWLACYSGLRACECAQLRGPDFLVRQSPPILLIRESKGGDPSVVPIAAPLMPVALELSMTKGWCFPKGRGGVGHITAGQVQKRANTFLHEIGIPETFHQLRHLYGTHAYRVTGRDLRATQELMRHRSPVSTAGYTFVDMGEVGRALDNLPRLTV
jgi:integrase